MKYHLILGLLCLMLLSGCTGTRNKIVDLSYNPQSPVISYGVDRLSGHLEASGYSVSGPGTSRSVTGISILTPGDSLDKHQEKVFSNHIPEILSDGYGIVREENQIYIIGRTDQGCLYGIMDLMEQLGPGCDFERVKETRVNPAFSFRAIKFNLPWAPYRPGPATDLHQETCRDLQFWEAFLDMMVENRFNALTLWSAHLFPYMIRAENFPEATPFSDQELKEWQQFWKQLFKMARVRGIETYLVNWNIVVSPEFADAYGADLHNDLSEQVKTYTRESVTQLINEYEDLSGLGVTLADWMGNGGEQKMSPADREEWIRETFVEGMKKASRKVKFIHRAVLAGDPEEMRRVIDDAALPDKTIVEVKFNWSHAHSTPHLSLTHSNDEGTIMRDFWDPEPDNYFITWMMRNEDFFVLRWGNPDFIREHIKRNHHSYVDGYFVGSEGYIPAKDYSYREDLHKTWDYAFEKQWMFFHLWGRLTYNPDERNEVLSLAIRNRYPGIDALSLLEAYSLASKVPLHLASFYKSTWDFTLYSEGFLAPWNIGYDDGNSPFISLEELIRHETLDAGYVSIPDYCKMLSEKAEIQADLFTPPELADRLKSDGETAMKLISKLRKNVNKPTLQSELDDLETWCHLGFYFADKLLAGVAFEQYRNMNNAEEFKTATQALERCIDHWEELIRLTENRYKPMPFVSMGNPEQKWPEFTSFHWKFFRDEVRADLEYVLEYKKSAKD